ncbi:MAG: FAD-binding oxidoreductase [Chloroflexota bacterium]
MMTHMHEAEVVVIGGGAVGCSIAYHLAKRGKDVTLIDKSEPGSGTSGLNFGLVWPQSIVDPDYLTFNIQSTALWPALVDELGEDVDFRQGGGLTLCLTEADYTEKETMMVQQSKSPLFEGRMISPEAVFAMQPGASRDIIGARWTPHDGDVDWIKWTAALERGCYRVGVRMLSQHEAVGFRRDSNNAIVGIETTQGEIKATAVVCAAGVWTSHICQMIGLHIDLKPIRGQILITEPTEQICPVPMSTVRQSPSGEFFMGITREDVGYDWTTTTEGYQHICKTAPKLVPAVQGLPIKRHIAGLRPIPADGLPLLGPVEKIPGFYLAVGHSGITLSPLHGKVISDLIVDGQTAYPIDSYNPQRFEKTSNLSVETSYL